MIKKAVLKKEEIEDIKDTLDIIDISIYDLIVKREELKNKLENSNTISTYNLMHSLSLSLQKITEQRKFNSSALSLTAGFLNAMDLSTQNITLALQSKTTTSSSQDKLLSNIKNLFPFISAINYKYFAKHTDIILNLLSVKDTIACLPASKTPAKDVWWIPMLSPEYKDVKVIGKVPFFNIAPDTKAEYLISKTNSLYNFDRSVIVLATSETMSNSLLKTALHKINIPLYNIIDSTAIFNGTVLYLVEISAKISSSDDMIFSLDENLNDINIRFAGYLGGYFLPIVEKDKIIDFKKDID